MGDIPGFSTRCITVGQGFDPRTGAVVPPIYSTSTFVQDGVGGLRDGYEYSRVSNPTRDIASELIANLEGGRHGFAFPSGMSAEDTLLRAALRPGDHVVVGRDVYGGTFRLLNTVYRDWGVSFSAVDQTDLDAVRAAVTPATRVIWVETPSNPMLRIFDVAAIADIAHAAGAWLFADNTFATPFLQTPLALGADGVSHSVTKYLAGHSDVLMGAVVVNDDELADRIGKLQMYTGPVASPFDSFLTVRGIKTLPVRMRQHCENAMKLAEYLSRDSRFSRVYYPGLPDHPGHELAAKQMGGRFGGIVSAELAAGPAAARSLVENTKIFNLAESIGGVESLICYPCEMTHLSVKGTELAISENLVRFSAGIENFEDQVEDLERALSAYQQ